MTRPQDAALLSTLEDQLRELTAVLSRLRRARRDLMPSPAASWNGPARHAYDAALAALDTSVDASIDAAQSALERTRAAVSQVMARA
jgi:hypothetical protein